MFREPTDDPHYRIKNDHGAVIIDRMFRLVKAGYRGEIRHIDRGVIPLVHPSKEAPSVSLLADGLVNDLFPPSTKEDRIVIPPEDSQAFDQFLARVPPTTVLQKVGQWQVKDAWLTTIAAVVLLLVVCIFSITFLEGAWNWIKVRF